VRRPEARGGGPSKDDTDRVVHFDDAVTMGSLSTRPLIIG
jgi:hypothetical protein